MPRYRDGREAKVGDVVCGRGTRSRYDLTGYVVQVSRSQGGNTNLVVAHCGPQTRIAAGAGPPVAIAELEYGDAAYFELLVPAGPALGVLGS